MKRKIVVEQLQEYIERVGLSKVAKKFNRSKATISKWSKNGVPQGVFNDVIGVCERSERAVKAAVVRKERGKLGIRPIKSMVALDELIGQVHGHTQERFRDRIGFYKDQKNIELARPKEFYIDKEGKLFYIDENGNKYRGYTVTGADGPKLFWTQSIYLDGYDSSEAFADQYATLDVGAVQIFF